MSRPAKELVFGLLLIAGAGIAFITYTLGVLTTPTLGLTAGVVLLGIGLLTVVPREKLAVTATTGVLGVLLAGTVVPRFVGSFTNVADELSLSLLLSGIILLLTLALIHVTTFAQSTAQTT